tara:strand:+ start:1906 stop:2586 length:681 start_codon:yes stop_codon:yes gene_type:complete
MKRSNKINAIRIVWLGLSDFYETWELQKRLSEKIAKGEAPETILLLEHNNVYTLGRRGKSEDILLQAKELDSMGIKVHKIDRGGEATYHGPGQLVGYPILNVRKLGGPLRLVCILQNSIISSLSDFGIVANCENKPTGVWVQDAKIGAIGLRVSKGISTHGFALNVSPDLTLFDHIVPCGMPGIPVTSMEKLLTKVDLVDCASNISTHLAQELGRTEYWADKADLI